MLDILAEFIIDLIQGRDQKKTQAQRQQKSTQPRPSSYPPQPGQGHWPERSASDPYVQDHPSDIESERSLTIDEVMRRMKEKAARGGGDAPVLDPQFHPRRPDASRPVPVAPPRPQPPRTYAPTAGKMMTLASRQTEEEVHTSGKKQSPDFATRLRNNPAAARDAFVFSEIFGRPLGERM